MLVALITLCDASGREIWRKRRVFSGGLPRKFCLVNTLYSAATVRTWQLAIWNRYPTPNTTRFSYRDIFYELSHNSEMLGVAIESSGRPLAMAFGPANSLGYCQSRFAAKYRGSPGNVKRSSLCARNVRMWQWPIPSEDALSPFRDASIFLPLLTHTPHPALTNHVAAAVPCTTSQF